MELKIRSFFQVDTWIDTYILMAGMFLTIFWTARFQTLLDSYIHYKYCKTKNEPFWHVNFIAVDKTDKCIHYAEISMETSCQEEFQLLLVKDCYTEPASSMFVMSFLQLTWYILCYVARTTKLVFCSFTDNAGLCGIPGLRTCGPHLSPGAKVGIALAVFIALLLIVGCSIIWWKRRQNILRAQKLAGKKTHRKSSLLRLLPMFLLSDLSPFDSKHKFILYVYV